MKKNVFFSYLVILTIGCASIFSVPVNATELDVINEPTIMKENDSSDTSYIPDELKKLYAQSACLLDGESGRVLFEKDGYKQRPMASTTKIMTCIVTLENANTEDIVTISKKAAGQPDVQLNAREGDQFKLKNLLYSLMLESHNDSAVAIAEHVGGSVEGFAKMMNQKARDIGCMNAHFVTPNGLDKTDEAGDHSITAVDLARVMSYCVKKSPKKDEFLEITRVPSVTFTNEKGNCTYSCNNHNRFLSMMDGALSGKTGFTNKAGYCYVGALERDGRTFIVALLGCGWPNHKTWKWADTTTLMNYGLKNYQYKNVLDLEKTFEPVLMKEGIPASGDLREDAYTKINIDFENDTEFKVLCRDDENVTVTYSVPKTLNAPIKAGTVVGSAKYCFGDTVLKEYPIYVTESVGRLDYKWCFNNVLSRFLVGKTCTKKNVSSMLQND